MTPTATSCISQGDQSNGFMPVSVDQRALVDKMLARYSGEFTVFRELLQNSDDAKSSAVEIRFKSDAHEGRTKGTGVPTLRELESTLVTQWTIRNNGRPFSPDDWRRLTEIAAGNPDSRTIGAFGVGFYSVFSVTENPQVSSQGQEMKFEWHGNQLAFREDSLPASTQASEPSAGKWITEINLPLRKHSLMPRALELLRFLARSITFMVHLREVQVYFDNHCVGSIKKVVVDSQSIGLPKGAEKGATRVVLMNIEGVQRHRIIISAEDIHSQREEVNLSMFTAKVTASLDNESRDELVRCMKKQPPSELEYSLTYGDHRSRSQETQPHESTSILQGLRADLNEARHTRIFIGHATTQTPGIAGHMASHFIPTVERELIDFSDANSAIFRWNVELLHIGGTLCRAVYEWELSNIQQSWEKGTSDTLRSRPPQQLQNQLNRQFRHVLRFFTFHSSVPSPKVAELLRSSFYGCSSHPLPLLSSVGVCGATDIRALDQNFNFLKSLPMLPSDLAREPIIFSLPDAHKIRPVELIDVLRYLAEPLNEEDLVLCLRWWIPVWQQRLPGWIGRNLLHSVVLKSADGRELSLSSVKLFVDSRALGAHIPRDGPLPEFLLPLGISQSFSREELASLHWQEFTVSHWLLHLSNPEVSSAHPRYNLTLSLEWAGRVLGALSRLWGALSTEVRRETRDILKTKAFIPTIRGLCCPEDSYLPAAHDNPFDTQDLAIVEFRPGQPINQALRTLLTALGVRGYVPPDLIFSRMGGVWEGNAPDLIRYLVQVDASPEEIDKLKTMPIFTVKVAPRNAGEVPRYCAQELYPPEPIFLELQLPVINWDRTWSDKSAETRLLYELGLNRFPTLGKIIELCSSEDSAIRAAAFPYFCEHLGSNYTDYDPENFRNIKFIPAENTEGTRLETLDEVCWGTQWRTFGFSIAATPTTDLDPQVLLTQLGIHQHPSSATLVNQLRRSSRDEKAASQWLECLVDCIPSLSKDHLIELSNMAIVPTRSSGDLRWVTPAHCFLGQWKDEFTRSLFDFVNFGPRANQFLVAATAKDVPSVNDVAESLIHDPERFFKISGGRKGFLARLGELATEVKRSPDLESTLKGMVSNRTLLGLRRKTGEHDQDAYELRKPDEIVIIDDAKDAELFNQYIWTVPQEDLESLYTLVGCRKLSEVIQSQLNNPVDVNERNLSDGVKGLIFERLPVFLGRCSHDKPKMSFESFYEQLEVKVCEVLCVSKTFTLGGGKTETQNVWAATRTVADEKIELWISHKTQKDYYDLAISLCRCVFGTVRNQDTLVLAAMFSDRELLKYVGHNAKLNGSSSTTRGSSAFPGSTVGSSTNGESRSSNVLSQKDIKKGVKSAISGQYTDTLKVDSCWPVDDLQPCGDKIRDIEIYAKDGPELDSSTKKSLDRFVDIVKSLADDVFKLHPGSLRIFFGLVAGPVAFNDGGIIYLNLQYFKAWHEKDVKQAQRCWFFVLAHEIAHNLVEDHNSDHEFWFAAVCAEYVPAFSRL